MLLGIRGLVSENLPDFEVRVPLAEHDQGRFLFEQIH